MVVMLWSALGQVYVPAGRQAGKRAGRGRQAGRQRHRQAGAQEQGRGGSWQAATVPGVCCPEVGGYDTSRWISLETFPVSAVVAYITASGDGFVRRKIFKSFYLSFVRV